MARDGTVRIWNVAKKKAWRTIEAHDSVRMPLPAPTTGSCWPLAEMMGTSNCGTRESGKEVRLLARSGSCCSPLARSQTWIR